MADVVFGITCSHSPQLSSGADVWSDHLERDRRNPLLLGKDYEFHSYDELLAQADPALAKEIDIEVRRARYDRCQDALAVLRAELGEARPDVAVVMGDDQRELFREEGIPTFALFLGEELMDRPPPPEVMAGYPSSIQAAMWAMHSTEPTPHPAAAGLSRHLADELTQADFDITAFTTQRDDRSIGHAFTFPRYRLGLPATTPIAPVFVNTYYPPNVASAPRCYQLGQVVGRAVVSWPEPLRVAIIATGGLSHFIIDTELDQRVLDALRTNEHDSLTSLPRQQFRSGTSEILNWIMAAGVLDGAGALAHLTATVVDYVSGYRTPAGTGTGMAFVYWR